MKYELPVGHGLATATVDNPKLLPRQPDGSPSLTDIQYEALEAGVAHGKSMLVVAPTSTGKTLIGLWGLGRAIQAGNRAVYLVTHRALAAQKFDEIVRVFARSHLGGDKSAIVLATGDGVWNGNEQIPAAPHEAAVLIATYEKYLAMLSSLGPRRNMTDTVFICDEVQIIGDKNRGQNVEILLTILRRSGWLQLIGLSAVLTPEDGRGLSDWLGVKLVRNPSREKRLVYECRTMDKQVSFDTATEEITETPYAGKVSFSTLGILAEVRKSELSPIIVFCMRVRDTYELAEEYAKSLGAPPPAGAQGNLFGHPPETAVEKALAQLLPYGVAIHNAELTEEERQVVEDGLANSSIKVVFATSTLAAGVNFPLGAAIFHAWKRWDFAANNHVPLDPSEFHNMAGRVGRMGTHHNYGLVVYSCPEQFDLPKASIYLDPTKLTTIEPRIGPEHFERLILQICSSGLCSTVQETFDFISSTLSGARELESNVSGLDHWGPKFRAAIANLTAMGFLA